ncbi:hypothetical protein ACNO7T_15750 [Vibrio campbellii]
MTWDDLTEHEQEMYSYALEASMTFLSQEEKDFLYFNMFNSLNETYFARHCFNTFGWSDYELQVKQPFLEWETDPSLVISTGKLPQPEPSEAELRKQAQMKAFIQEQRERLAKGHVTVTVTSSSSGHGLTVGQQLIKDLLASYAERVHSFTEYTGHPFLTEEEREPSMCEKLSEGLPLAEGERALLRGWGLLNREFLDKCLGVPPKRIERLYFW